MLPPLFEDWFAAKGWQPRAHQLALAESRTSVLLVAPTGGGKTLAGFLPSLIDLAAAPKRARARRLHTLYISPLKALAVDVARNLETPIAEMGLAVSVETRTWYNEDLESSAFIVPGVLALVMSVIGAFLTSLTIAREWERGTMEQLISTPVTPLEIMMGKLLPYFAIGMFDVIVCALIALYWFHVPFRGSFATLLLSSAMFMIVVLSLGFFISVIAKNQLAASQIALIATFLPAFLLSGFLYAIEQMPVILQYITRLLPARYYVSVLKKIFLKGSPAPLLYSDLIPLAVFTVLLAILATRAFHKRLT